MKLETQLLVLEFSRAIKDVLIVYVWFLEKVQRRHWRKFVQLLKITWFGLGCLHGLSYMNKVICLVVIFRRGSEWGGGDQGESECSGDKIERVSKGSTCSLIHSLAPRFFLFPISLIFSPNYPLSHLTPFSHLKRKSGVGERWDVWV